MYLPMDSKMVQAVPDVEPEAPVAFVEPLVFVVDCGLVALVTVQK